MNLEIKFSQGSTNLEINLRDFHDIGSVEKILKETVEMLERKGMLLTSIKLNKEEKK